MSARAAIPPTGRAPDDVIASLRALHDGDADWRGGRVFSLVYHASDEHRDLLRRAHETFFSENALNPMAFRSLRKLESDIVQMTATLLHGGPDTVGTLTTGGTESILMAVKAARDRFRSRRPWVRRPEIVAPRTAHVAFEKAAHYFGLRIRYAPVGADQRADADALRSLTGSRTALLVASAPQYPHGVVDPIEAIGALAADRGVPLHVDACVGGFLLPFVERLGHPLPRFDFRVPGVTSMSADLHKYGFAAKGASVVLYRDMSYLRHQFFVATDFPGGVYVSPTMTGTRGGGPIAAAWASLVALGESGFLEHTRLAMEATRRLRDGVVGTDGLALVTEPDATIVAYLSTDRSLDIYAVADRLEQVGWTVDRQHRPASIHCTVTSNHLPIIDEYVQALRDAVAWVRAHPEVGSSGNAPMYGMMAKLPARGLVKRAVLDVMEKLYAPGDPPADVGAANEGPLGRAVQRWGGTLSAALDRIDDVRSRLRRRP